LLHSLYVLGTQALRVWWTISIWLCKRKLYMYNLEKLFIARKITLDKYAIVSNVDPKLFYQSNFMPTYIHSTIDNILSWLYAGETFQNFCICCWNPPAGLWCLHSLQTKVSTLLCSLWTYLTVHTELHIPRKTGLYTFDYLLLSTLLCFFNWMFALL